ncbi:hypothetical protein U0070_007645, partial [Myodes glareolus]
ILKTKLGDQGAVKVLEGRQQHSPNLPGSNLSNPKIQMEMLYRGFQHADLFVYTFGSKSCALSQKESYGWALNANQGHGRKDLLQNIPQMDESPKRYERGVVKCGHAQTVLFLPAMMTVKGSLILLHPFLKLFPQTKPRLIMFKLRKGEIKWEA